MLPMMRLMRFRLLAATVVSGGALATFGAGVASASSVAVNGGATYVSATSEMLNGVANTTDPDSAVQFEYATTPDYSGKPILTPAKTIGKGTFTVTATITGLTTGTTYYFRLVVGQGSYNTAFSVSDTLTFTAGALPGGNNGGGGGAKYGKASLVSRTLHVRSGKAGMKFRCRGASDAICKGTVSVTARGRLGKGKPVRTYNCGRGTLSASGGRSRVVKGKLSKGCRTLLKHARHHKLHATIHGTWSGGQAALKKSVTLVR
jgi:hypothetical protein